MSYHCHTCHTTTINFAGTTATSCSMCGDSHDQEDKEKQAFQNMYNLAKTWREVGEEINGTTEIHNIIRPPWNTMTKLEYMRFLRNGGTFEQKTNNEEAPPAYASAKKEQAFGLHTIVHPAPRNCHSMMCTIDKRQKVEVGTCVQ